MSAPTSRASASTISKRQFSRLIRALRTVSACNQAIVRAESEQELLELVCQKMVEVGGYRMAWVGYAEQDEAKQVRPVAHAGLEDGYLALARVSWADDERGRGPTGSAIRSGLPVVNRDTAANPALLPWREEALKRGYASSIALPLRVGSRTVGALTFHAAEPDAFDDEEVKLLSGLADDLSFGIDALRTRAERQRAEEELLLKTALLEAQAEATLDGILVVDEARRVLLANRRFREMWNIPEEVIRTEKGAALIEYVLPQLKDPDAFLERVKYLYAHATEKSHDDVEFKDGRIFDRYSSPLEGSTGKYYGRIWYFRDITERQRAQEALRQSEATLRSVFRAAPVGICILKDRVFESVNRYWCEALGYPEGSLTGKGTRMLYESDEEWERVGRELYADLHVRGLGSAETKLRCRDGSFREVVVTAAPIRQGDPSAGAVAVVHDVTERKQTERALHESERKYRELVEHANTIILRWTHDGRITFLNEFGLRFFGYSAEEIIGRHVIGTIVPTAESSGRDLRLLMDQICADPAAFEQNVNENMRRNGERVWIAWANRIVRDPQGQVVEILSVGTDITERKTAEEALRRNEQQFRLITENLADLVAVLDLKGRRIYNSPSYREILGDPNELRGSLSFEEIHPEDKARVQEAFEDTVRTGKGHRLEYRLLDRQGRPRYIESQGSVVRDAQGQVAQVVVVSRDVTERRKAEEAIRELNVSLEKRVAERTAELAVARDRAEAADRLKSAFLATMSHELRTPLNSIIGFTGIILQGLAGPLNGEQRKQLEMVRDSARHLLALINDVLDISKIEAGQLEVNSEPFDLRASIAKVVGIVKPLAEKKGLALRAELEPEIGTWVSDARRVEQVLLNLLNNAIKFTERGAVTLRAETVPGTLRLENSVFRISIADTGIGIKVEDLSKLFQPFRQVDTGLTRQHEGTGLGLAICRRLAGLLGGEIHAASEWGKGSVFTLTLPMKGPGKS